MAITQDVGGIPNPNMMDFTGSSRGMDANTAFERLFKGTGDAIDAGVKVIDTSIKLDIEKQARAGFEDAMAPYTATLPAELKQGGNAIQQLQAAYEQNKISDTYYYGQLTNTLKKLRAKYPGYESEIDSIMQSVTGVRPANAYREAVMNEISQQEANRSNEAKFQQQWEKENEAYITSVFPDYFTEPGKYAFENVRAQVAGVKAQEKQVDLAKSQIELSLSQGKLTDEKVLETARAVGGQVVDQALRGVANVAGVGENSQGSIYQKIADFQQGGFTPEEYNQLLAQVNSMELQARATIQMELQRPFQNDSSKNLFSVLPGDTKAFMDDMLAPITQLKQMIADKDTGLATYYLRLTNIKHDQELNRILNISPDLNTAYALRDIGPDLASQFLNTDGRSVKVYSDIAPEAAARIVLGQDDFNAQVDRTINSSIPTSDKVSFINSTLDNLLITVKGGKGSPEQIKNTVNSLYSLNNEGKDLFSYIDSSQYMNLYYKMFNNEVTNAIKTYGTPEDIKKYFDAAYSRTFNIPELRQAAATLSQANTEWQERFEVSVDPKTGKLQVGLRPEKSPLAGDVFGKITYAFDVNKATDAVNKLNVAFDTVSNIWTAMGEDTSKTPILFDGMVKRLNVDLEGGNKNGFFGWIGQFFSDMFTSGDESNTQTSTDKLSFNTGPNGLTDKGTLMSSFEGSGDTSNYYEKIRSAESGGDDNARAKTSSAGGRYQFIDSTWNTYARRLGLTDKMDPQQQEIAIKAFTADNANILEANGIPISNQSLYAAHFLGAVDAVDALTASDDTPMVDLVAPRSVKANEFLRKMTVSDFKAWLTKKVG